MWEPDRPPADTRCSVAEHRCEGAVRRPTSRTVALVPLGHARAQFMIGIGRSKTSGAAAYMAVPPAREGWQMPVHNGVHAGDQARSTGESQICAVPPLPRKCWTRTMINDHGPRRVWARCGQRTQRSPGATRPRRKLKSRPDSAGCERTNSSDPALPAHVTSGSLSHVLAPVECPIWLILISALWQFEWGRFLDYWISAEDIDDFNDHIVEPIEVVAEYR